MGASSNCASADCERDISVTGKREKCAVIGVSSGREALTAARMDVVNGSRAVLEEGTRIPKRMAFEAIVD